MMQGLDYPRHLLVREPNAETVEWVARTGALNVAELGVYRGHTTREMARVLPEEGSLDLFDFTDVVAPLAESIRASARCTVRAHGNSRALRDSYCWSLARLLAEHDRPIWDYVFIDGAHTWDVDGFAFLLVDRLLRPGGHVDFDDYGWTLMKSPTMRDLPITRTCYTSEQMAAKQVAMVIDLLVTRSGYTEMVPHKIFRKPL